MTVPAPASPHTPQWRFDRDGIEAPAESYFIAASRLAATRETNGAVVFDWPLHLAEKEWVRLPEFLPVFRAALAAGGEPVDPDVWARTVAEAEQIARNAQEYLAERERRYAGDPFALFEPRLVRDLRAERRATRR